MANMYAAYYLGAIFGWIDSARPEEGSGRKCLPKNGPYGLQVFAAGGPGFNGSTTYRLSAP
jgi:hypothetical protein